LVVSYQNSVIAQTVSAELIFVVLLKPRKLPVSIHSSFKVNDGLPTEKLNRLGFTTLGMSGVILSNIDAIANKAIDSKMTPGIKF
jgi:hypothetical protein